MSSIPIIDLSGDESPPKKYQKTKGRVYTGGTEVISLITSPSKSLSNDNPDRFFVNDPQRYFGSVNKFNSLYNTSVNHQQDVLFAKELQEKENIALVKAKRQEQDDLSFATALQLQLESETKPNSIPKSISPPFKDTIPKANEIASLYADNEHVIPNIHELFVHFDKAYFNGALSYVVVKWSYQMKL